MPALYEGSSLYMPSAPPGISTTQATSLLQEQDRIIRSSPEVKTVFGTVGRSDSATDNAPLDMELTGIKTAVGLKIQGPDLARVQDVGAQIQQILSAIPDTLNRSHRPTLMHRRGLFSALTIALFRVRS